MPIHYTYRLTHKTTGQFYIGSRTGEFIDIGVEYFSSGVKVKEMGFKNFNIEIIDTYPDRPKAWWHEQYLIWEVWRTPLNLNGHVVHPFTGKKMFCTAGRKLKPFTEEHRANMRKAKVGRIITEKWKKNLRKAALNRPPQSPETIAKRIATRRASGGWHKGYKHTKLSPLKGKKKTESHKQAMRDAWVERKNQ